MYRVYCENANRLFRGFKTGELIIKMFRAGGTAHYKEAQGCAIDKDF
jgi:hypothetical protein